MYLDEKELLKLLTDAEISGSNLVIPYKQVPVVNILLRKELAARRIKALSKAHTAITNRVDGYGRLCMEDERSLRLYLHTDIPTRCLRKIHNYLKQHDVRPTVKSNAAVYYEFTVKGISLYVYMDYPDVPEDIVMEKEAVIHQIPKDMRDLMTKAQWYTLYILTVAAEDKLFT